ncbi:MAG: TonB family protein [Prevotella sp.]|nr:TonB family protein [Prevotella sp.]
MTDFLIYDAKVAVLIAVFYMFYRLMLSRETFHRVNRVVLLLTAVASFVLPLCVITMHKTVTLEATPMVTVGDIQVETVAEAPSAPWQLPLSVLFIIGMVLTLCHTLSSVLKVWLLIRKSERHPQPDGTILCVIGNAEVSPFSWMHYIVMNRSDYEEHNAAILAHERGHIRLRHSWDLLLVDLLTALQWFNPAMWMLRQDLRAIHEYEADGAVLSQGINARQYQYLLITKAVSIGGYSIANGISHSTLKNRITMMLHKKSPRSSFMKLLALIPIVGVALALNAETVKDYVYQQPPKKIVKKGKKNATAKMGNNSIEIVPDKDAAEQADPAKAVEWIAAKPLKTPMVLLDGNRITYETLGKISSDEIASITVLKDQAAVDQYGEEARDGILLVTTKKGVKDVFVPVEQNPEFFDVVEQMPEYPGGPSALFEYLAKNIRYPESAEKAGIQGRVIATFVVMKDGSISNVKVVKSVSPELDTEALRVLSAMPNWTPGMQNGKAVNVKYTVPISFALPDSKIEETKESSVVVVKMK